MEEIRYQGKEFGKPSLEGLQWGKKKILVRKVYQEKGYVSTLVEVLGIIENYQKNESGQIYFVSPLQKRFEKGCRSFLRGEIRSAEKIVFPKI